MREERGDYKAAEQRLKDLKEKSEQQKAAAAEAEADRQQQKKKKNDKHENGQHTESPPNTYGPKTEAETILQQEQERQARAAEKQRAASEREARVMEEARARYARAAEELPKKLALNMLVQPKSCPGAEEAAAISSRHLEHSDQTPKRA